MGEIQPIRARKAGVKILKRHLEQCPKLMYSNKQTITRLFFSDNTKFYNQLPSTENADLIDFP
jgi:hypothetical protein